MHAVLAFPMDTDLLDRFREADYPDEDTPAPRRSIAAAVEGASPLAIVDGTPTLVAAHRDAEGKVVGFSLEDAQ